VVAEYISTPQDAYERLKVEGVRGKDGKVGDIRILCEIDDPTGKGVQYVPHPVSRPGEIPMPGVGVTRPGAKMFAAQIARLTQETAQVPSFQYKVCQTFAPIFPHGLNDSRGNLAVFFICPERKQFRSQKMPQFRHKLENILIKEGQSIFKVLI